MSSLSFRFTNGWRITIVVKVNIIDKLISKLRNNKKKEKEQLHKFRNKEWQMDNKLMEMVRYNSGIIYLWICTKNIKWLSNLLFDFNGM